MSDEVLTTRQAADYLKVSQSTLEHLRIRRVRGKRVGLKWFKVGAVVRYRRSALDMYAEEQQANSRIGTNPRGDRLRFYAREVAQAPGNCRHART